MKLKNDLIQVRVSQEEREHARRQAEREGISVSEWIRCLITRIDGNMRLERIESLLTRLVEEKEGK